MGALVDLFVWIYYRDCVEGLTRKCGGGLSLTISKRVVASLTHEVSSFVLCWSILIDTCTRHTHMLVHTYRYVHTPHTQTHTHPHPHTHCSAHHGSAMQVLAKTSRSKDGWLACRKAGGRELFVLLDAKLSPASVSEAMDALCDEYFGSVFIH